MIEPAEINHDVLFREGIHNKYATFTPRMLMVDLKGTLKYVPETGNLYQQTMFELNNPEKTVTDQVRDSLEWDEDKVEVMESEEAEMPQYQKDLHASGKIEEKDYNLKDTITNWPDFMYTRYHPRSINTIRNYEHQEDMTTLDTFTAGSSLWDSPYFQDDFCDKIRAYIEECDFSQGFQTLFDAVDGFSGLSIKCLEHLEDEYSKSILAFPLIPPYVKTFQFADEAMSISIRLVNTAFSYAKLSEHSSLFVPLSTMSRAWRDIEDPRSFANINYDSQNLYHSSAILATFLDTSSLRYRLKDSIATSFLPGFCSELNCYNRKMAGAKISLPLPMNVKEDFIDFLDHFEGQMMESLTPGVNVGTDRIIQSVVARGVPKSRLKRPLEHAKNQMKMAAYKCSSVSEMLQLYYQCSNYASLSHVTAVTEPMKLKSPYPKEFFDERFASSGFLKEFLSPDIENVQELPVMTAVQTSHELSDTLNSLYNQASRVKVAKIPRFMDSGLESLEFKEILEQLLSFKEQYDEGFFV